MSIKTRCFSTRYRQFRKMDLSRHTLCLFFCILLLIVCNVERAQSYSYRNLTRAESEDTKLILERLSVLEKKVDRKNNWWCPASTIGNTEQNQTSTGKSV
jgi:hypothetical protein